MKNRLLFIITDLGSFNNFLVELSISLCERENFEIHVITSANKVINTPNRYDFDQLNIKFYFVDIPRGYNLFRQFRISRKIYYLIKSIKPSLIHIHFTTAAFTTLLYKKPRAEVWGTFHGLGSTITSGLKGYIFKTVEKFCIKKLDKLFVLNESDYQSIVRIWPQKVYKLQSLGLGCDIRKFNPLQFSHAFRSSLKKNWVFSIM